MTTLPSSESLASGRSFELWQFGEPGFQPQEITRLVGLSSPKSYLRGFTPGPAKTDESEAGGLGFGLGFRLLRVGGDPAGVDTDGGEGCAADAVG